MLGALPVGAPIRHADHAVAVSKGGPTPLRNGDGRCESCNLTKDLAGWTTRVEPDGAITTHTPTGHTYTSRTPKPPTSKAWPASSKPRPPRAGAIKPGLRIEIHWPADELARYRQ